MNSRLNLNQSQRRSNLVTIPLSLIAFGLLSLVTIDHAVGNYFTAAEIPGDLKDFIDAAEHFGTPYGQILALLCLAAATGWRERRVVRIFIGTSLAGLAANLFKLLIGRTRPRAFDFETGDLWSSFVAWFPFGAQGSSIQSFPSAHTASAFGFAAMLTWAFPKGRSIFLLLGFLVGVHRITTSAHFPSDVFFGAAVGWIVGWWFTGNSWSAKPFDRFENQNRINVEQRDTADQMND